MSKLDPRLPGEGITFRITRDDGVTAAGVTVPAETYTLASARAALAAATGLSAAEQARANNLSFAGFHQPRGATRFGPGWAQYAFPASVQVYVLRDDFTHLSVGFAQPLFTIPAAIAALLTTAGLSAAEQARINSIGL